MKHIHFAHLNQRASRNTWLFSLAAALLGMIGLTKAASAQISPQISIPPQQLQDIQRAVEPPINQPTNSQLLVPYTNPPFSTDPSQRLEQTPTGKPGDQRQQILKIDPAYNRSGSLQQERHYDSAP